MPWCPTCSGEYKAGAKKCPGCGAKFKTGNGNKSAVRRNGTRWVLIRSVPDSAQASLMKSYLESNGWEVAVSNGNGKLSSRISENTHHDAFIGIFVPESDARDSAKALRSVKDWSGEERSEHRALELDFEEPVDYELDDDGDFLESNGIMASFDEDDYPY